MKIWSDLRGNSQRAAGNGQFVTQPRGFVQLTWRKNYERAEAAFDKPLLSNPDLALDIDVSYKILSVGMLEGWFGQPLGKYINESLTDYINARRSVNILDHAEDIAEIAESYEEILLGALSGIKQPLPIITAANASKTIPQMQIILGVEPDGAIGPATRAAMAKYEAEE